MGKIITLDKPGCIIAGKNGLLVAAYLLGETSEYWEVHARDEKRSKKVAKADRRWQVFNTTDTAIKWQEEKP